MEQAIYALAAVIAFSTLALSFALRSIRYELEAICRAVMGCWQPLNPPPPSDYYLPSHDLPGGARRINPKYTNGNASKV